MRTKTLLVAGAISALALTASLAQSVYSVNVVGYVNAPLVTGYNCLANPLDASPDNDINNVIKNIIDGSVLIKWTGTGFTAAITYRANGIDGPGWYIFDENIGDDVLGHVPLETGEGFFLSSPGPTNITFVGDVKQGPLSRTLNQGYNLLGNLTPQSGNILTPAWNFPAADGDVILFWNAAARAYYDGIPFRGGLGCFAVFNPDIGDDECVTVTVNPAQGFFYSKAAAGTVSWSQTFTVQ